MWHNGDELVADHIVWNVKRWLTPGLGTSNVGLATFGAMRKDSGKKDKKGKAIMVGIDGAVEALDKYNRALQPVEARPVRAGGLLPLSGGDPASVLQAAALE